MSVNTTVTVTIGSDTSNDVATQRGSPFKAVMRRLCTLKIIARVLLLCWISVIPVKSFAQSCYYPVSWEAQGNLVNGGCLPTDSLGLCLQNGANWATNAYVGTGAWALKSGYAATFPNLNIYGWSAYTFASGTELWVDVEAVPASCAQNYWVSATVPRGETCSANCVGDPVNPALGNVYTTEEDVKFAGAGAIKYQRFYNSADATGVDGVLGWRHSYDRSIGIVYLPPNNAYPGLNTVYSPEYSTQAAACTQGFAVIQSAVSAWAGATASYNNGSCVISSAASTIDTLPIQMTSFPPPSQPTSPIEYDVVRDDGQILRYTLQNGVINNPPGVSVRLAVNGSGFTVTDDQDTVETYNSAGVLQSITSRAGVVQTLSYTSGVWSGVTDSFGNSLSVTRNTSGTIASVAVTGGGTVQYSYDSLNRLSIVTNLDSTTRRYGYTNSSLFNALTSVVDENGITLSTWAYNAQEQATSTQEALGADAQTLVYNSNGSVQITDALGAVRTFSYSRVGDINKVTGISGSQCATCEESAATTYDGYGWVSSRTDYNGNLTCYANDPTRGLELVRVEGFAPGSTCPAGLSSYTPASGTLQRKITTTWSSTWREPSLITEPNRTTAFTFDGSGNVLTKIVTDLTVSPNVSRTWTYTYNGYGQVLTAKGPRTDVNSTSTYTYYSCSSGTQCGQVETIQNAVGQVTTFNTYNAYGQPLTLTDPNGVVTTLSYDTRERITSSEVGTETTSYTYWPTGLLKLVTLPDSSTILYTYDGAHRLTTVTDGLGNYISYTLDAMGNHTADNTYDPSGTLHRTHTRVFNTVSELYQDINAAGTAAVTTTLSYDAQGNQTAVDAPLSRNTAQAFDALNRLSKITDPNSGITQLGYDANDNLASVTDPRSLVTSYSHNGFNDVTKVVSPDSGTATRAYDSGGNLQTTTDARGVVGTFSYDALNRLTQQAYADQTISFTYDSGTNGKGRLTGASDANHSMAWSYDTHGRVTGKAQKLGTVTKSVGYAFTNGYLTSLVTPSGQTITYTYTNHRITSMAVNGTTLLSGVTYDPLGPATGWTWGNSTTDSRTYDEDGGVTQISTVSDPISYAYDNASRITGITDSTTSAYSWTLGYDVLDRLTSAAETGLTIGWTYDANGNRLSQTHASASTFNVSTTSNRLASTTGALTRTYAYDAAGNATSYATSVLAYNDRGRLASDTVGSTSSTLVYNALGQMIKYTFGSTSTMLLYDEAGHVLGEYTTPGTLMREYLWMGDIPVAELIPNGTSVSVYYIHTDQLNAPRKITLPSSNAIVWRWDPHPFGEATPNQNPSGLGTFINNLRFPGQFYTYESGLNNNGRRDYDPQTGAYTPQSDPLGLFGRSFSTYAYTNGNPISLIDPLGLWGTLAHHEIIQSAFPNLPSAYVDLIMAGSDSVDSIFNQFGDTNYMHAMRGPNESVQQAQEKMCRFINDHMNKYNDYMELAKIGSVFYADAYRELGIALHPVMDSTSPMHEGFQVWNPSTDWVWHGDAHGSLEGLNMLTPDRLQETINRMNNAMNGNGSSCGCGK